MNREIKFRAWDTERKEMAKVINWDEDSEVTLQDEKLGIWTTVTDYIAVLMQYTGLNDKHGTPIYEGDIVKGCRFKNGKKYRHIGTVTYLGSSFKVKGVKQYRGMNDELSMLYEIIGNIYENPELVETCNP